MSDPSTLNTPPMTGTPPVPDVSVTKPKADRRPPALHLVIDDDTVTVFGQEVDALRHAMEKDGARYVRAARGEPVKLRP